MVSSFGFRLEAWRFSVSQFWNAPIFGQGIGSYQNLLSESCANGSFRWKTDNLHMEIASDLKLLMSGLLPIFGIIVLLNSSFKEFG